EMPLEEKELLAAENVKYFERFVALGEHDSAAVGTEGQMVDVLHGSQSWQFSERGGVPQFNGPVNAGTRQTFTVRRVNYLREGLGMPNQAGSELLACGRVPNFHRRVPTG